MNTLETNSTHLSLSSTETVAIILAAGQGTRAQLDYNKVLYQLGGCSVLERTFLIFTKITQNIVVVASPDTLENVTTLLHSYKPTIVTGGTTRFDSVKLGLQAIKQYNIPCDIVTIHDCARCFVTQDMIDKSIKCAKKHGSGIAAIPCTDTIKQIKDNIIVQDLDRVSTFCVQTPQSFDFDRILLAYKNAPHNNFTDDSAVYSNAGFDCHIVQGSVDNIKLTHPNDFLYLQKDLQIGHGYDVHQLKRDRPLILGGIKIDYHLGLFGHSDADVLTHAIMDALLSAAGLPDIGVLFSDKDTKFKDACSINLLKIVHQIIELASFKIRNISAVIIAQNPKLQPYIFSIENNLAQALSIPSSAIKISATTTESLGVIGQNQGMSASAMCLLNKQ
jgi:2-C-methyl-D-erythritol 4-phosphate cytidylyltransferase/2-C-methyl-D-erythritol 2,4-cyclodiphosphate synthase